ncbi:hypothetical protein [Actinomadura atramentaria]|uniref:hypothetical protein n=1 Tax=Actinomadura atramentaria TaxID=1990 RepID=UPI00037393A2|nr:hypothetical protein [Actinomadura atramentaria]
MLRGIDRHGHIAGRPGWAGNASADGRMSGDGIARVIKDTAARAGLGHTAIRGHSLRAGGATGAYLGGADLVSIGRHGGWSDGSNALLRYIRDVDRWQKNPMHGAGL